MKLNETLNILTESGISFPEVPNYITDNLGYELRDYQKEAISRYLYFRDIYHPKDVLKSHHLLWQMATGSGKTLIMASLILEMYKQGYRNFWFFVNSTDIITKTIDNFINSSARKYQFAPKIEIDGDIVEIKKVENFSVANTDAINIKFSTINILHQISQPELSSENSVSLEDIKDLPIVLIGDESHHLNASTKKEKETDSSWENSVRLLLKSNSKNRLFEFTATAELTDKNILEKYDNKLIYNYDLKRFRENKYSKDVFTNQIDIDLSEIERIMLRVILISQYRKQIASNYKISMKPVIMFKSKQISENKINFDKFNTLISNLTETEILKEFNSVVSIKDNDNIWNKTITYFSDKANDLVMDIKEDFNIITKKVVIHDTKNEKLPNQYKLLSTLENADNPVRVIFTVDMLKEGWDVLNLFDIVRLYDTRDGNRNKNGNYVAGKSTISEAQLIGRGARYCPFNCDVGDKYRRKFDHNENEPLRVLEQMHYHCKHNPEYISEIRNVLIKTGILWDDFTEITLKMKQKFIDGDYKHFQDKDVFVNEKMKKEDLGFEHIETIENRIKDCKIKLFPNFCEDDILDVYLPLGNSNQQKMFDKTIQNVSKNNIFKINKLSEFCANNIIRWALNRNKNFTFDKLKKAYPNLERMSDFITELGKKKVKIIGTQLQLDCLTPDELLFICQNVVNSISLEISAEQKQIVVTKYFNSFNVSEKFEKKIVRKFSKPIIKNYDFDWYVYENSVLTDVEISFVEWFENIYYDLEKIGWKDIFLIRNEKSVKLYSWFEFNIGDGFEPDFVLLMQKGGVEYVFYIEPKGDWTLDKNDSSFGKEKWKQNFLLEIKKVVDSQQKSFNERPNWRLIGLPFYNENVEVKKEFEKEFRNKCIYCETL